MTAAEMLTADEHHDRITDLGLVPLIRSDMAALCKLKSDRPLTLGGAVDVFGLPGFWSVLLYRLAHWAHTHHLRPLSRVLYFLNMMLFSVDLPGGIQVGPGLAMPHPVGVGIARDVVIGSNCKIMGGVRIGGGGNATRPGHPTVGDDVWLLDGAKVFGPVHVADATIVGASAILYYDTDPGSFVFGPRAQRRVNGTVTQIGHWDKPAAPRTRPRDAPSVEHQ